MELTPKISTMTKKLDLRVISLVDSRTSSYANIYGGGYPTIEYYDDENDPCEVVDGEMTSYRYTILDGDDFEHYSWNNYSGVSQAFITPARPSSEHVSVEVNSLHEIKVNHHIVNNDNQAPIEKLYTTTYSTAFADYVSWTPGQFGEGYFFTNLSLVFSDHADQYFLGIKDETLEKKFLFETSETAYIQSVKLRGNDYYMGIGEGGEYYINAIYHCDEFDNKSYYSLAFDEEYTDFELGTDTPYNFHMLARDELNRSVQLEIDPSGDFYTLMTCSELEDEIIQGVLWDEQTNYYKVITWDGNETYNLYNMLPLGIEDDDTLVSEASEGETIETRTMVGNILEVSDILVSDSHANIPAEWRTVLMDNQPFFFEMGSIGAMIDYAVRNNGNVIKQGQLELNYNVNNADLSMVDFYDVPRQYDVMDAPSYETTDLTIVSFRFLPTANGLMFQYNNTLDDDIDIRFKTSVLYHIPGNYIFPNIIETMVRVNCEATAVRGVYISVADLIVDINSNIEGIYNDPSNDLIADIGIDIEAEGAHGVSLNADISVLVQSDIKGVV